MYVLQEAYTTLRQRLIEFSSKICLSENYCIQENTTRIEYSKCRYLTKTNKRSTRKYAFEFTTSKYLRFVNACLLI